MISEFCGDCSFYASFIEMTKITLNFLHKNMQLWQFVCIANMIDTLVVRRHPRSTSCCHFLSTGVIARLAVFVFEVSAPLLARIEGWPNLEISQQLKTKKELKPSPASNQRLLHRSNAMYRIDGQTGALSVWCQLSAVGQERGLTKPNRGRLGRIIIVMELPWSWGW